MLRYAIVGLISLVGATVLIRELGPAAWASYSVAYFLLVFIDQYLNARLLGALVRGRQQPSAELREGAVWLMNLVGLTVLLFSVLTALVLDSATDLPEFELFTLALGCAVMVACFRAVSSALLERRLAYGWIGAAEIIEQLTFYGSAIALVESGAGLSGVAFAFGIRGVLAAILLRSAAPSPFIGRRRADRLGELLTFALPTLGISAALLVEGLIPVALLSPGHADALAFFMTAGTLVGYAGVAQIVANRVGFAGLSRLRAETGDLTRALGPGMTALVFVVATSVVPFVGLSPLWLDQLFGPEWMAATPVMAAVGVGVIAAGPFSVMNSALYALDRPRDSLRINSAMVVLFAVGASIGFVASPTVGVAVAFGACRLIGLVLAYLVLRCRSQVPSARRIMGPVIVASAAAVAMERAFSSGQVLPIAAVCSAALVVWLPVAVSRRASLVQLLIGSHSKRTGHVA